MILILNLCSSLLEMVSALAMIGIMFTCSGGKGRNQGKKQRIHLEVTAQQLIEIHSGIDPEGMVKEL